MNKRYVDVIRTLLLCTVMTCPRPSDASGIPQEGDRDSGLSVIKMKLEESFNTLVQQSADKLKSMRDNPAALDNANSVRLKMDKINSRFVEHEGEIYDQVYNLTWARCSVGQQWVRGTGCRGIVWQLSFDQCGLYTTERWRLPTARELSSLIDRTKNDTPTLASIDSVAFPDMDRDRLYYWSGTEESDTQAWAVLFIDGGISGILYRDHRFAVRLVRDGR